MILGAFLLFMAALWLLVKYMASCIVKFEDEVVNGED